MYSRRNNQRDGFYGNRSRSNSGFENQNSPPMMGGQGQGNQFQGNQFQGNQPFVLKRSTRTGQIIMEQPKQTFLSQYSGDDYINLAIQLLATRRFQYRVKQEDQGLLPDVINSTLPRGPGIPGIQYRNTNVIDRYDLSLDDQNLVPDLNTGVGGPFEELKKVQKAMGGGAYANFLSIYGLEDTHINIKDAFNSINDEFRRISGNDMRRLSRQDFLIFRKHLIDDTASSVNCVCSPRLIALVLLCVIGIYDKRVHQNNFTEVVDGRRRRRSSKRSKRSKRSKSVDGKRRRKSRSKSADVKRRGRSKRSKRSKKSRSKKSRSKGRRRSKHMSAKKLLKLLRKL